MSQVRGETLWTVGAKVISCRILSRKIHWSWTRNCIVIWSLGRNWHVTDFQQEKKDVDYPARRTKIRRTSPSGVSSLVRFNEVSPHRKCTLTIFVVNTEHDEPAVLAISSPTAVFLFLPQPYSGSRKLYVVYLKRTVNRLRSARRSHSSVVTVLSMHTSAGVVATEVHSWRNDKNYFNHLRLSFMCTRLDYCRLFESLKVIILFMLFKLLLLFGDCVVFSLKPCGFVRRNLGLCIVT